MLIWEKNSVATRVRYDCVLWLWVPAFAGTTANLQGEPLPTLQTTSIRLRPVLIHLQQRHDVLAAESFDQRQRIHFAGCGRRWRRHPGHASELDAEREILLAELQLEAGRKIALERIREALCKVVRAAAADRQHVIEL